jgi:hypothetical protein
MQAWSYPRPTKVSISATFNSFKKSGLNCRCERLKISWNYYSVAPNLVLVADSRLKNTPTHIMQVCHCYRYRDHPLCCNRDGN